MNRGHLYIFYVSYGKVSLLVSHRVSVLFFYFMCMCVWCACMSVSMFASYLDYVSVDGGHYHLSHLASPHIPPFLNF